MYGGICMLCKIVDNNNGNNVSFGGTQRIGTVYCTLYIPLITLLAQFVNRIRMSFEIFSDIINTQDNKWSLTYEIRKYET